MILLLIFGLIAMLWPGWLMACCGMGLRAEEEPVLVWFFRLVGVALFAISIWFIVAGTLGRH